MGDSVSIIVSIHSDRPARLAVTRHRVDVLINVPLLPEV